MIALSNEGFLTSIKEVDYEFYKQFLNHTVKQKLAYSDKLFPFLQLTDLNNEIFNTLVRYFKRGGKYKEEATYNHYPVITIQNFTPVIDKERRKNLGEIQGNFRTENGINVGDIMSVELPILHKYQISVATYFQKQLDVLLQWFYRTFNIDRYEASFLFKKIVVGDNTLGVPTKYYAEIMETNIEDKFEFQCDFKIKSFVSLKQNVTKETIESIQLICNEMTPEEEKYEVYNQLIT